MKEETNPKIRPAVIAALMLLLLQNTASEAHAPDKPPDVVYFHVKSACSSEALSGITLSVIGYDGKQIEVGQSNDNGLVIIERPRLERAQLIMACADDYFCTAIKNPRAQAGTEILILLAPFAMT